jgi:4-aminobutyrate aminotransferase-like enzyme
MCFKEQTWLVSRCMHDMLTARTYVRTTVHRYGGNPVCSAGGRAVLRVVDREARQAHCAAVGAHLQARLRALADKHDIIGDVRGAGLMLGVEFVKDKATKASVCWWGGGGQDVCSVQHWIQQRLLTDSCPSAPRFGWW